MGALTTINLSPLLESAVRDRLAEPALDVVVAAAGRHAARPFLDLAQDEWQATIGDAKRAFREAQAAAARWESEAKPGRIVFLATATALRVVQGAALDAAAGAFLTTIGQVGAVELGARGITVNTVVHGWIEGEDVAGFVDGIPVGRLAGAEEIAGAIAFLASEPAAYITGAVLAVDGGFWITKTAGGSPLLR